MGTNNSVPLLRQTVVSWRVLSNHLLNLDLLVRVGGARERRPLHHVPHIFDINQGFITTAGLIILGVFPVFYFVIRISVFVKNWFVILQGIDKHINPFNGLSITAGLHTDFTNWEDSSGTQLT
ncbi:hypothetical protein WICPIJ_005297 [Wickerhamomyces pijperi]|uniref:Uncharacterized protein n=1 Tax=Wickerhamomyces pijperi TaxID=599730 RepID=A0A9P8TMH9_WICPI|nr:hypothetical protein WICPIJ_005297 [Wickerhamomyces pijperi]